MPTGHYSRQPRVQHIKFTCKRCGAEFEKRPGEVKQRQERMGNPIQFCSRACMKGTPQSEYVNRNCGTCGKAFKIIASHFKYEGRGGYCSRRCMADSRKVDGAKWRDPEQIKAYMRQYRKENWERLKPQIRINTVNRRARKRGNGGKFTLQEWEALKTQYDYRCLRCDKQEPEITLTVDHVIPVSQGGSNAITNIQPLCKTCNSSKSVRMTDYRRRQQRLIEL